MSDLTAFREKMVVVLAARKERRAAAKLHEQQMQQAAKAEAGKKRKADAQAAKAKKAKPAKKHNPRVFFGESRKACLVHTATAVRGVVDGVRVCCDCNQPRLPCISAQRLPCFSTSPCISAPRLLVSTQARPHCKGLPLRGVPP